MKKIKIRLFGAFRNLESTSEIEIDVNDTVTTIGAVKTELAGHWTKAGASRSQANANGDVVSQNTGFDVSALIQKSAMANEREILFDDQLIAGHETLAILPPVSGG